MDNIDKLIEAIEHPDSFSESELSALLSDPETMKLYRLLCAARSGASGRDTGLTPSEIDNRWRRFKSSRRPSSFLSRFYSRKVAAVVAVLIASCSIIVVGVSLSNRKIKETEATQVALQGETINSLPDDVVRTTPAALNDTVIIFEDEKLDRILAAVAPYYNARVDLQNPKSKDVRLFLKWDSTTPLDDLIDHLNSFDRINLFLKEDTITDY